MDTNLLLRILSGEATAKEKAEFYQKLGDSKEEEEMFYQVKSLWIRSSMQNSSIDTDSEFENLWARIKQPEHQNSFSIGKRILQYAAIVLVTLSIGGLAGYFISKEPIENQVAGIQKFTAMKGSVSIVEFSDGTKVWLNSGSQLSYQEDSKKHQRLAELSGEAYFEVKHREDCPLLVKVGQLVVRDLGTTFNIKAYPGDQSIETSLVEGKAEIFTDQGQPITALNPGELATYSKEDNKVKINLISDNVLSAWRDGKFVIRDQRLEDIFNELSRWYDIRFQFENQALRNYRYTGNIKKSTTAQHVLKMLKLTTDFNYKIVEKSEEPDLVIIF